jgi:lysophospholipase L1-like esterase
MNEQVPPPTPSATIPEPPLGQADAGAGRPLKLLALGASDVVGVGADDPAKEGWAPVLAHQLPGRVSLMKLGISGALAATLRAQLLDRAIKAKPDLAVVFTGVNDCVLGVALPSFEADLSAIVTGLVGTGAQVYVVNLPDIWLLPALKPVAAIAEAMAPRWQAAVREVAARHGARTVDLGIYSSELSTHKNYLAADGYHPSTRGYRRMAEIIYAQLSPVDTWLKPRQ